MVPPFAFSLALHIFDFQRGRRHFICPDAMSDMLLPFMPRANAAFPQGLPPPPATLTGPLMHLPLGAIGALASQGGAIPPYSTVSGDAALLIASADDLTAPVPVCLPLPAFRMQGLFLSAPTDFGRFAPEEFRWRSPSDLLRRGLGSPDAPCLP